MRILSFDLQRHGFIDKRAVIQSDAVKHAKVSGHCCNCAEPIRPKQRVRVVIAGLRAYRYCTKCCAAMIQNDYGKELDRRYRMVPILHSKVVVA